MGQVFRKTKFIFRISFVVWVGVGGIKSVGEGS